MPNNFQSIFEYLSNNNEIDIDTIEYPSGYTGEQFKVRKDRKFNASLFTESELETLDRVATVFKKTSTNDIVDFSHLEAAWKDNCDKKSAISYEYAFELKQI